jgi:diguanylate cyclase (GGDEF)-like protein
LAANDFYIMVVDDEESIRSILYEVLASEGYNVITASSGEEALSILNKEEDLPHIVMTDIRMPGIDGVTLAEKIKKLSDEIEVIIMTSYASLDTAQKAIKIGVYDYINKPFRDLSEVKTLILSVINKIYLRLENKQLMETLKLKNKELTEANTEIKIINKEIESMYQFGKDLLVLLNSEEIIDKFLYYLGEALSEDKVCVFLKYHQAKTALVVRNIYLKNENKYKKLDIEKTKNVGLSLGVTGEKDILSIVSRISNHPSLKTLVSKLYGEENYVAFPVIIRNAPIGVVLVLGPEKLKKREENLVHQYLNQLEISYDKSLLHSRVKDLAIKDGLTGLYNHRFFQERLDIEIENAKRLKTAVSIIFFDIDHFKNYNDTNGHPMGDMILRGISKILKTNVRITDIPCRYGGEEFCIIFPHTDIEGAKIKAERLRKTIEETEFPNQENQPNGNLTVSIGISSFPLIAGTSSGVLKAADDALYMVKETGRNKVMLGKAKQNYTPLYTPRKIDTRYKDENEKQ